jgi:hypothetical protein
MLIDSLEHPERTSEQKSYLSNASLRTIGLNHTNIIDWYMHVSTGDVNKLCKKIIWFISFKANTFLKMWVWSFKKEIEIPDITQASSSS